MIEKLYELPFVVQEKFFSFTGGLLYQWIRFRAAMKRRVLVAEDEQILREMLVDIFEDNGFDVVAFDNADDACSYIHAHACPLDLLFTDVKMPGDKTGLDLAFNARQLRPDLPVVISSGYFEGPVQTLSEVVLLPKPWDLQKLEDICQLAPT